MQSGTMRRRRPVDPLAGLEQALTIRSRPLRTAQACLPGGLIIPAHRYLWYYEARTQAGELVASIHLGEGIVIPGYDGLWRVTHRDGVFTLNAPAGRGASAVASYFVGNAGLFHPVRRLTLGADRVGGYEVGGNGWRGGWIDVDGARVLSLTGDGDPPTVFHVTPGKNAPAVPTAAVLLLSYVLTERELRSGSWIPRPRASTGSTQAAA